MAAEVKALSQEDRAKLRGHGVRFGAHTLFLPALLKPAPTEIRMLLWWLEQLKAGTVSGLVPTLPPNGLTSMVADAAMPEGFYRMGGYRISGKRAVRVDMLERLADMIRDRLFWKPRIPEEQRPVGSFEGGGFTIVPDMMSVVGCSGEDFQDILTSLGYRSQNRQVAKPVQVPHAVPQAVESTPQPVDSTTEAEPAVDSNPEPVEAMAEVAAEPAPEAVTEEPVAETPVAETPAPETPAPEMIEVAVWWPKDMGPFKSRPPRADKPRRTFTKPDADKPHQSRREEQNGEQGKREHKPHRKPFDKNARKPERKPERPARPEKPMDPNSPFAALAALKAAMSKGNG